MPLSTKEAGKNEHHELNIPKMYAKSVFYKMQPILTCLQLHTIPEKFDG